jgi:hypothetical protein
MKPQFKVKKAVIALKDEVKAEERLLHLLQLLAWAFLDQKAGKRAKRTHHTTNARRIARLYLGEKIDSILQQLAKEDRPLSLDQKRLLDHFLKSGGVAGVVKDPSYKSLFRKFKKNEKHTRFVFYIVRYLCRAADAKQPEYQRTIAFAQNFVLDVEGFGISKSTLSQSWERYAPAAALIYSTYLTWPHLSSCELAELERQIRSLASDKPRIITFLGYAAHAAEVLSATSATKAFTNSFLVAPATRPIPAPFSPKELAGIAKIMTPSARR